MANSAVEITDHAGLIDWLTPKGVISVSSFIFRAIIGIFIAIGPVLVLSSLTVFIDPQGQSNVLTTVLLLFGGASFLVGLWIILATVTKHYRTKGMFAPFFFALITPVMPLMLIVTWIFSSKERRLHNEHLAKQQAVLRKMAREKRKTKSIDENPEPRYGRQSKAAKRVEPILRDNDAPTVRRRR